MGHHSKILIWGMGILAALLILRGVLVFFLPFLVNLEPLKERILAAVSERLGAD